MTKYGNNYHGTFYWLVDADRVAIKDAYFQNSDSQPQGSATITLELQAGQIVRVENFASTRVFGTDDSGLILSWFTGHLLYAL